jgi:hypothetical protein
MANSLLIECVFNKQKVKHSKMLKCVPKIYNDEGKNSYPTRHSTIDLKLGQFL